MNLESILSGQTPTSATIVPASLRQNYTPQGFHSTSSSLTKVLIIAGEPRKYSLTYDFIYTTMAFLEQQHCQVELRDLYDLNFDPVLRPAEFYYVKDGQGPVPDYLQQEQRLITQAQILIFAYPNWHDAPVSIVKGYMEKVFAYGFAYRRGPQGLEGLLTGKKLYTIMNCGYLGGGQGYLHDGIGHNDALWDQYMQAFKTFDEDTAHFWGMHNAGRFMNDQSPRNFAPDYASQLNHLRATLRQNLQRDLLS